MDELIINKQLAGLSDSPAMIGHNVPVHTSLPPQVEGHLRCFVCLCISQIKWIEHQHPKRSMVHVTWWGEAGPGTVFRPFDGSKMDNNNLKTTARYPVRSGPKQFKSYLNDMNVLLLEVLDEDSLDIVGYAEVDHIATLTTFSPLKSTYSVSSLEEKKIAELHVSVTLEPLMESYDSSGFLPTVDISSSQAFRDDRYDYSTRPSIKKKAPMLQQSSMGEKNVPQDDTTVSITTGGNVVLLQNGSAEKKLKGLQSSKMIGSQDMISVLLEKGKKLRETMILSMADQLPTQRQQRLLGGQGLENTETSAPLSRSSSYGSLLREILTTDDNPFADGNEDPEERMINLVLGEDHEELVFNNPDDSSISSFELDRSDISDPLHESDILQNLFYTNELDKELLPGKETRSFSIISLEDPNNKRPSSRRSSVSDNHKDPQTQMVVKSPIQEKSKLATKPKSPPTKNKAPSIKSKTMKKSKPSTKPPSPSFQSKPPLIRPASPSSRSKLPIRTLQSPPSKEKTTKPRGVSPKARKSPQSCTRKKMNKNKTKRRRNSTCTASGSEASDTDSIITCYSESSRVSFDMAPSDVEESENESSSGRAKMVDGLSIERLTLLGRATIARVGVDILNLFSPSSGINTHQKSSNKLHDKPPKPKFLPQKSSTYFLEYQFPVVAAARDKYTPNTMATEVTRAVAKQVNENIVRFNHHSVFPLLFDGKSIENWWKSAINFKIYSRTSDQKTPFLIGSCLLSLKSILKSENLCLEKDLVVCKPGKQHGSACNSSSKIGHLKVSVNIGSDAADFSSALSRTRIAELNGETKIVPIVSNFSKQNPLRKSAELPPHSDVDKHVNRADLVNAKSHEFFKVLPSTETTAFHPISSNHSKPMAFPTTTDIHQTPFNSYQNSDDCQPMTLNSLLIINEARKIPSPLQNTFHPVQVPNLLQGQNQSNTRNIYLQCRMFWCDQSVSSSICWGTNDPEFNFVQVSPIFITSNLLERMRNNYLIIEVWDKQTNTKNDELVGIVKLSLHQFYLSLRNKKILSSLLKAQYPIIAHDCFVPIVDPLSNCQRGQLKVLLAIGSVEQVSTLQRVTLERYSSITIEKETSRNVNTIGLENPCNSQEIVEHLFEIVVEDINHFPNFEEISWGETDCFIQYFFPFQTKCPSSEENVEISQQASLKPFRTAAILCSQDASFQSITKHKFILSPSNPLQTHLLNGFVDQEGNVAEVFFELWGRFYHPNVRDQKIAMATLPLVKLFALISMFKKEPLLQCYSLPLVPAKETCFDLKNQKTGNLNISITYKNQIKQSSKLSKSRNNSYIYISVGLLRICGLQAAAEYCTTFDPSMQYPRDVGVNTYIKAKLSFVNDRTCTTRTFNKTFSPEVGQFFEFHCPLVNKDSCSFAEILESGELLMEFWHQVPSDLATDSCLSTFKDVLLGVTEVPLIGLLTKKTGIHGWLPINKAASGTFLGKLETHFSNQLENVVGGIEVKVNFTRTSDQERVLHAADIAGWNLPEKYLLAENFEDFEDEISLKVTINIDEVNVAKKVCLSPNETSNSICQCYLKYTFHDKGPFVSKPLPFRFKGKDFLFTKGGHQNTFHLPLSAPFIWYLREESIEVQLWCGSGGEAGHQFHRKSERSKDRLIGSSWIPLNGLCQGQKKNVNRISGIYPMFKADVPNLHGMYLRAHISLHFQKLKDEELPVKDEESSILDSDWNDSFLIPNSSDFLNVFQVHVSIEKAMHLTHITDKSTGKLCQPNAYVSFTTAHKNKMAFTRVRFDEDCPVWEYDVDTILSSELLYEENKNLVFKVWHKPANIPKEPDKSSDQVIGFVSVDLTPLVSGLKQLCGWYNIIDFNGRCRGQVKLSVIPMESIAHHWNQLKSQINQSIKTDEDVSFGKRLPHFNEHYQNVKLHHELLQNQHEKIVPASINDNLSTEALETTKTKKKVAFASTSSSRLQLMSKLQRHMDELDDLNSHLKSKLDSFEQENQFCSKDKEKQRKAHHLPNSNSLPPNADEQNEAVENNKTLYSNDEYTEEISEYFNYKMNTTSPKGPPSLSFPPPSPPAAAFQKVLYEEEKEKSLNPSDRIQTPRLDLNEIGETDYMFTAYPIGKLSSDVVLSPDSSDSCVQFTAVDSEIIKMFTQQDISDEYPQIQSCPEEDHQIFSDGNENNSKESNVKDFYVLNDDDDDSLSEDDENDENFIIPRIMNDICHDSVQPQTLENKGQQENEENFDFSTQKDFIGNIAHIRTDKKPPNGLTKPQSCEADFNDFSLCSDISEFPDNHDTFQDLTEKIKNPENHFPEIGKHIICKEECNLDLESTVTPSLPPEKFPIHQNREITDDKIISSSIDSSIKNVPIQINTESTMDEGISINPCTFFPDERLSPNPFPLDHHFINDDPHESCFNQVTKNPEKQTEKKKDVQNKRIPFETKDHLNKILHTNFFLPLVDLEQSMKAVKLSSAIDTYKLAMDSLQCEKDGTSDPKLQKTVSKELKMPHKLTPLPPREESKRIARIFSMKF